MTRTPPSNTGIKAFAFKRENFFAADVLNREEE